MSFSRAGYKVALVLKDPLDPWIYDVRPVGGSASWTFLVGRAQTTYTIIFHKCSLSLVLSLRFSVLLYFSDGDYFDCSGCHCIKL